LEWADADSFWLTVKREQDKQPIKVRVDLRLLPGADAQGQKVGDARTEPYHSPQLAAPAGRIKLSANPLELVGQLLGPELVKMLIANLTVIACLALCAFCLPMIVSNLVSNSITGVLKMMFGVS